MLLQNREGEVINVQGRPTTKRKAGEEMNPTDKQIKEFWEWCLGKRVENRLGFWDECGDFCEMQSNPYSQRVNTSHHEQALCYLEEDRPLSPEEEAEYRKKFNEGRIKEIPTRAQYWLSVPLIDLNNLFKYAVPKLDSFGLRRQGKWKYVAHACLGSIEVYDAKDKDPALALFWAIYKVTKEEA